MTTAFDDLEAFIFNGFKAKIKKKSILIKFRFSLALLRNNYFCLKYPL